MSETFKKIGHCETFTNKYLLKFKNFRFSSQYLNRIGAIRLS